MAGATRGARDDDASMVPGLGPALFLLACLRGRRRRRQQPRPPGHPAGFAGRQRADDAAGARRRRSRSRANTANPELQLSLGLRRRQHQHRGRADPCLCARRRVRGPAHARQRRRLDHGDEQRRDRRLRDRRRQELQPRRQQRLVLAAAAAAGQLHPRLRLRRRQPRLGRRPGRHGAHDRRRRRHLDRPALRHRRSTSARRPFRARAPAG